MSEAGLEGVRWSGPRLSPAGAAEDGRDYWADLLDEPPIIFLEGVKSATATLTTRRGRVKGSGWRAVVRSHVAAVS